MGRADHYEHGQWNAICDRCGFKFKSRALRAEWTGLRVCGDCWDPRHPQDFVRGKVDRQAPPWTRPEAPDVFTDIGEMVYDGEPLVVDDDGVVVD